MDLFIQEEKSLLHRIVINPTCNTFKKLFDFDKNAKVFFPILVLSTIKEFTEGRVIAAFAHFLLPNEKIESIIRGTP